MKNKKRVLTLLLSLVLCAMLIVPAAGASFTDVRVDDWFFESVNWAIQEGVTNGTSATTFSPNQTCVHAQVLTFLWRAAGEPEATIGNPYKNAAVIPGQYYYKALLWAWEAGLVYSWQDGLPDEAAGLDPNAACKRSDVVTYLWKLAGRPNAAESTFSDVSYSDPYATAVSWAVKVGITEGTSAATFSPNKTCTRGQIVTFLHRYFTERTLTVTVSSQAELDALPLRADADRITAIYAVNAGITDISALSGLSNLTYLQLYFNGIDDLDPLRSLTGLTYLDLSANDIENISALSGLTGLTELNLSSNRGIRDVDALGDLYNLQKLNLDFNKELTQAQINELQAKLPDCKITWWGGHSSAN